MQNELKLESLSFVVHESPLYGEWDSSTLENQTLPAPELRTTENGQELLSPRLWDLPDVFRKKLVSYSTLYLAEVQKLNRLSDSIRYNFSDGTQISAQEILRHRYHRMVPLDILPNGQDAAQPFERWPFLQQGPEHFISQGVFELEVIMQNLLTKVMNFSRNRKFPLYFQFERPQRFCLTVKNLEFAAPPDLTWNVQVLSTEPLVSEVELKSRQQNKYLFFESFILNESDKSVYVYPFQLEERLLKEKLSVFQSAVAWKPRTTLHLTLTGDFELKSLLQHLRKRQLPLNVAGEQEVISPQAQWSEVHIHMDGTYSLVHACRTIQGETLKEKNWSHSAQYVFESLQQGWSWVMGLSVKDLAASNGLKREWDTRLLKHLGVHHYLHFETLHLALKGKLSDSRVVSQDKIVSSLTENIKRFLVTPQLQSTVENIPLEDLISKPVLEGMQKWCTRLFEFFNTAEIWLRPQGEYLLDGLFRRESELILELYIFHISRSGFDDFKRPKWEFFKSLQADSQRMWITKRLDPDPWLIVEFFQNLIQLQYQIFFNQSRIEELKDQDFAFEMGLSSDKSNGQINWFELNPQFFLKGEAVSLDSFLHSRKSGGGVIEYQGQYYLIPRKAWPSVKRLEFFWEKLQKGSPLKGSAQRSQDFRVPRHQTLELLALRASGVKIRGDESWNRICHFYDHLGEEDQNFKCPEVVRNWLKPYQFYGLQWLSSLYELRLGALLADDMGLGKTLQTLSFFEKLRMEERLGKVMVVVPSSLVFNWSSEIQKFTPELPCEIFTGPQLEKISQKLESSSPLLLIVTYGLLMEHHEFFQQYKWNVTVFDEAQNLKNRTAKRTIIAKSVKSDFKIALTGTPMENHYGEFYSIVDLLVPGALGDLEEFRKVYVNPSLRLARSDLLDLKLKVKPLLLRRSKKEILSQLPDKQESVVSIAFEQQQKEIYRDIALSYNESVKSALPVDTEGSIQLKMLTALLRLRQACSDPSGLPNVKYDKIPPKIEALVESLEEITASGESALVFTQFLKTLDNTVKYLTEKNVPVLFLHGGLNSAQRQKVLKEFQSGEKGQVLVMTLKTGGVGLNLTQASYVFHLEPWWNPAVENQATDRAHRLGQTKAVQVFRYIMHESLEEKIETLKGVKNEKFKALFQDFEESGDVVSTGHKLTREDFQYLLGLSPT
ncbi:MAG: DEAD/DEAH box helicase [Bdellovibrionales bacterium]